MRANGIMVRRRGAGHTHHGGEEIRTIHREESEGMYLMERRVTVDGSTTSTRDEK